MGIMFANKQEECAKYQRDAASNHETIQALERDVLVVQDQEHRSRMTAEAILEESKSIHRVLVDECRSSCRKSLLTTMFATWCGHILDLKLHRWTSFLSDRNESRTGVLKERAVGRPSSRSREPLTKE